MKRGRRRPSKNSKKVASELPQEPAAGPFCSTRAGQMAKMESERQEAALVPVQEMSDLGTSAAPPSTLRYGQRNQPKNRALNEGEDAIITYGHEVEVLADPCLDDSAVSEDVKTEGAPKVKKETNDGAKLTPASTRSSGRKRNEAAGQAPKAAKTSKAEPTPIVGQVQEDATVKKFARIRRAFFHENVTDWNYFGNPLTINFKNFWEPLQARNLMYHEIKLNSGGKPIHLDLELRDETANPNDTEHVMFFKVAHRIFIDKKSTVSKSFASVKVTANPGNDTYFRFYLDDPQLASLNNVSVQSMRRACEVVFATIVTRCEEKDGLSVKDYEGVKVAEMERRLVEVEKLD